VHRPVRVELVGMLPDLYKMCPKGADMCQLEPRAEQMQDYPPAVLKNQEEAVEIFNRLLAEFGWRVLPITVGTMSWRGFWLSLKHRLGQDLAIVVEGRRVVLAADGYHSVRLAVAEALERAAG
jgi:hypothetical protein